MFTYNTKYFANLWQKIKKNKQRERRGDNGSK